MAAAYCLWCLVVDDGRTTTVYGWVLHWDNVQAGLLHGPYGNDVPMVVCGKNGIGPRVPLRCTKWDCSDLITVQSVKKLITF